MTAIPASEATLPGTADLLAEFRAIEAEMGEGGEATETEAAPETPAANETPERDASGKFVKKDAKAEPAKDSKEAGKEKPKAAAKENDGKPTIAERAQFREEKREWRAKAEASEAQLRQYEQQLRAEKAALDAAKAKAIEEAPAKLRELFERGDADAMVKALGIDGIDSWEKINDHFARQFASPEYRRVREVERKLAETQAEAKRKEEEQAQRAQAYAAQQEQQREAALRERATVEIADALKAAEDPEIAGLSATDPRFNGAVLAEVLRSRCDISEAAETVRDMARAHYIELHKVFGTQTPSKSEAGSPATPVRAGRPQQLARPNKHVSRSTASEASPPADENLTDAQWLALANQDMKAAFRQEQEERTQQRR